MLRRYLVVLTTVLTLLTGCIGNSYGTPLAGNSMSHEFNPNWTQYFVDMGYTTKQISEFPFQDGINGS